MNFFCKCFKRFRGHCRIILLYFLNSFHKGFDILRFNPFIIRFCQINCAAPDLSIGIFYRNIHVCNFHFSGSIVDVLQVYSLKRPRLIFRVSNVKFGIIIVFCFLCAVITSLGS